MVQLQEMGRWHVQVAWADGEAPSTYGCHAVVVGVVQPAIMSTYGHRRGLL